MRFRWPTAVILLILGAAIVFSSALISWLVRQRVEQTVSGIKSLCAEIVITEWSEGRFTSYAGKLTYGGPASWSLRILTRPAGEERLWVQEQGGLWCYSESVSTATWIASSSTEDDLSHWFLLQNSDWLKEALQFDGRVKQDGSRYLLLTRHQAGIEQRYYIDTSDFLLKRYEEISPKKIKVCSWYNVCVNCSVPDVTAGLALPVTVPLLSIYDLEHPLEDGTVAVPYDLKRLQELQQACGEGHQTWRLDPVQVAMAFITAHFSELAERLTVKDLELQDGIGPPAVVAVHNGGQLKKLYLEQLVEPGAGGIWTVTAYLWEE